MAHASARNFIHYRLVELRAFFQSYYPDHYVRRLSMDLDMAYPYVAELMDLKWGDPNGRPGDTELLRLNRLSAVESFAYARGWRSRLTQKLRKGKPETAELAFPGSAGEGGTVPLVNSAPQKFETPA